MDANFQSCNVTSRTHIALLTLLSNHFISSFSRFSFPTLVRFFSICVCFHSGIIKNRTLFAVAQWQLSTSYVHLHCCRTHSIPTEVCFAHNFVRPTFSRSSREILCDFCLKNQSINLLTKSNGKNFIREKSCSWHGFSWIPFIRIESRALVFSKPSMLNLMLRFLFNSVNLTVAKSFPIGLISPANIWN